MYKREKQEKMEVSNILPTMPPPLNKLEKKKRQRMTIKLRQEIAKMTKSGHSRTQIEDAVKLETGFTLHRSTYFDIKRNAEKILALNTSRAKNANFRRKDETVLRQFERDVALRSVCSLLLILTKIFIEH